MPITEPVTAPAVLVVEPQQAVRARVTATLRGGGYRTMEAADALTAWRILSNDRQPICLLVIDPALPGLAGGVLVELAHGCWPFLPVLIVSDEPHIHLSREYPALANVSFVRRSFHADDLVAIADSLVARA